MLRVSFARSLLGSDSNMAAKIHSRIEFHAEHHKKRQHHTSVVYAMLSNLIFMGMQHDGRQQSQMPGALQIKFAAKNSCESYLPASARGRCAELCHLSDSCATLCSIFWTQDALGQLVLLDQVIHL